MKIYTKTGDAGETGLLGGGRVKKHDARVEAYGTVDELNAALGIVRAQQHSQRCDQILNHVQTELFSLGAELATPSPDGDKAAQILETHVERLEEMIDLCESDLEPLRNFILPGGCPAAAHLHYARTVCRRAERRITELAELEPLSRFVVVYLNRLGDLLFVLARNENAHARVPDVKWLQP